MKIYLFIDSKNIIYGYHTKSVMPNEEIEVDMTSSQIEDIEKKLGKIKYENGVIQDVVFEEVLTTDVIRTRRRRECFPIINRGQLWYNTLSEAQLVELNAWYRAWLDAPETLIIPEKPLWLVDAPETEIGE
jgi:hypothetical protein